jgi:choline dehydrogenase-like flavoprotein
MSIDDLRTVDITSLIETDLCLIGSGPAGWTIAEELRDSGLRILMVESGGPMPDAESLALNEIEDVGVPLFNGRTRVLGGTSRVWSGRCIPFDSLDYEERSWVPRSGWPFGPATMASYVNRASEYLGAGPYYERNNRRPMPEGLQPRPRVDPSLMRSIWWEDPACIDFGRVLTLRRSANLRILVRATVTHLNTDPSGRQVRSVEVADASGRRLTVHAHTVVLCAGGVENARILLYSNRVNAAGVGNAHDLVGRHLMDHPRDFELIARVEVRHMEWFRSLFGPYRLDSQRGPHDFFHGFVLSPEQQRSEGLLNTAAWPYEVVSDDDPFSAMKRLAKGPHHRALRDVRLVATQPGLLMASLRSQLMTRQRIRRKVERVGFLVSSEQSPDPDSRVQLSQRRDWLGLPITRINWRIGELEARSQATLAKNIASEFARLGLPPVRLADWVRDGRLEDARFQDGCHPSGTTRMADDPTQGVVDADCQVHGVDSLYVAGSSIFPTGSHANPTLMIVALAVRLSQHLRERLSMKAGAVGQAAISVQVADAAQ